MDGLRDRVEHAIRRKAWMKATSVAALKGYEELLRSDIHELIDCLSKRQGKRLDISLWITLAS